MKRNRDRVRAKILEIADAYRRRGYEVLVEPATGELPSFLADFQPDMIARGPEDSVVVEVRVGTRTAASEGYKELAETIRQHAGWRFSLVVVDPRSDDVAPSAEQLLTREQIVQRLETTEDLLRQGAQEAAFVLLWASTEALLRHMASLEGFPLERLPSSALLKESFSLGLLSREGLETTTRAFSVRNSLVHGFDVAGLGEILGELSALTRRLLTEYDQAGNSIAR